jgi:serine/threonine protein kinase
MLERGDMSLHSFIRKTILPLATFKSILFQLLFGLYIGQRELEFQHNDLHSKNVLVKFLKDSHDGCAFYARFDDSEVRWLTKENFVIKLTDFGHSRIKLASGEVICNNKDPFSTIFDPKSDLKKIEHELRTVKIDWTNSNEQPVLKDLKSKMRDPYSYPPGELLLHPFFDSLKREGDLTLQERKRLLHFDRRGDFSDEIEALAQHVADVHVDKENTAPEQTQTTAVRSRRKRKRLSNITNETPVAKVVEKRKIEEESEPVRVVRRRTRIYNK